MQRKNSKSDAIKKFKDLTHDVNVCMFTTLDEHFKISSRPMSTVEVDNDGNAWFFTNEFSDKLQEVSRDNTVNLLYAHPARDIYVNVKGNCTVVVSRKKMEELWRPFLKAWFPKGVEDPKLCLLRVNTEEAHYWNNSSGKMKFFFNMLPAVTKQNTQAANEEIKAYSTAK